MQAESGYRKNRKLIEKKLKTWDVDAAKKQENTLGKNHNISTDPFLFIIRRFECCYTHCQETALN